MPYGIARHIKNAVAEGEIDEKSNMQILHNTQYKYRPTKIYSLDVIISVGYRVKSMQGVQFRRWANSVLKQYLIKGYAVNQKRLENYNELKNIVHLMSRAISLQDKVSDGEYSGLFNVIREYADSVILNENEKPFGNSFQPISNLACPIKHFCPEYWVALPESTGTFAS